MAKNTWLSKPTLHKAALLMRGYRYARKYLMGSLLLGSSVEKTAQAFAGYYVERATQSSIGGPRVLSGSLTPGNLGSSNSFHRNDNYTLTWDKHAEANMLLDERWLSGNVLSLLGAIENVKGLQSVYSRMPILGDVLLDAGCDCDEIIAACQSVLVAELPMPDESPYRVRMVGNAMSGHQEYTRLDTTAYRATKEYKAYYATRLRLGRTLDGYENVLAILNENRE